MTALISQSLKTCYSLGVNKIYSLAGADQHAKRSSHAKIESEVR